MKQTPNINLPILEQGDRYLKETQNEAFSVIDREIAGINSAISVLDNVEGSIIDTKSDVETLKNETNTLKASLNDVASNVIPNIQTSLETKTQGIINVAELGAKMDGSDETDILIQAHDLLPLSGGKIIIPSGKLLISEKVEFTKTVILEGVCVNQIDYNSSSTILTKNNGELVFKGNCSGVSRIFVSGVSENTGNGITMLCGRPWIENVTVTGQGNYGISIGDDVTDNINVNSFYLANIRTKANKHGLFIGDKRSQGANANAGCIVKIDASYNKQNGIVIKNAYDNNFLSCHIEMNEGYGVVFENACNNYFAKPYSEANTLGDWKGDSKSEYNFIDHTRYTSDITHGYLFDNVNNNYTYNYLSKGIKDWKNKIGVDKLIIANKESAGFWNIEQNNSNGLDVFINGTSSNTKLNITHGASGNVTVNVQKLQVNNGTIINDISRGLGTKNYGYINANSTKEQIYGIPNAKVGAICLVSPTTQPPEGITWSAYCIEDGKVIVRLANVTNNSIQVNMPFNVVAINLT